MISYLDVSQSQTRIGVVSWSDSADVDFNLNKYTNKQDVLQALQYIKYNGGRTNTAAALFHTRTQLFTQNNGDRENIPNVLIIITDGNSNINPDDTIEEAIKARVDGIHIMTVSIGKQINRMELRGIASEVKDDNMFTVDSFNFLDSLVAPLFDMTCDGQ